MHRIALVGSGKLARALAHSIALQVVVVSARDAASAREVVRICGEAESAELSAIATHEFDVLWIATSDGAIESVAASIAAQRESWSDVIVVHSAGTHGVSVLMPFESRGADVLALHPNTALRGDVRILPAVVWGVSPTDEESLRRAAAILHPLAARLLPIEEDSRTIYHAAASVASNFAVTLYAAAEELYAKAGVDESMASELVGEFMSASVERCLAEGPHATLTGPIVRGDIATVDQQRRAVLKHAPDIAPLFEALVDATKRLAKAE